MALLGKLLKKGIKIRESLEQDFSSPIDLQKSELKKLLIAARHTSFGKFYYFDTILNGFKLEDNNTFYNFYKSNVPIFTYDEIHDKWWKRTLDGEKNICWPGKVKYFALSSGTSGSSSKYIPVTTDMVKSIQKTSVRQLLTLSKYDLPEDFFGKGTLMIGGSTDLKYNGKYYEGDLSGITTGNIPFWFQRFYKPGKKISRKSDWEEKLNEMVLNAEKWDIGIIAGVPAWAQILMEKILTHYNISNIHEIWPNFRIFVHGGVSFEPYKNGFEKLLGGELIYLETYLASEGFMAFKALPNSKSMHLVLNNGIFYEFIPFNEENFDETGQLKNNPETLKIDDIEEGRDYALLLSTNAGTWRYLIGDVIRFVSKENSEIVIVGRTKHFLSLCGEHLSMDNMNKAIQLTAQDLNINIKEFTVVGEPCDSLFAHRWYIGTNDMVDKSLLKLTLDAHLKRLNDDYCVERKAALKEIFIDLLPADIFYGWMKSQGKAGGQHKFPRVLAGDKLISWESFISEIKTA
ncbi:GH3 auxin-responsive promoter family protein [Reichenbachiella sp. MALMAid0571]|uniref:GH3 family domain-containing protein n=1 Tax=Reichenbachiella sp. MALMAid0571 TaxID=3143939 RepID=UPI0032DEF8E6